MTSVTVTAGRARCSEAMPAGSLTTAPTWSTAGRSRSLRGQCPAHRPHETTESSVRFAEALNTKALIFNVKGEDLLFLDHSNIQAVHCGRRALRSHGPLSGAVRERGVLRQRSDHGGAQEFYSSAIGWGHATTPAHPDDLSPTASGCRLPSSKARIPFSSRGRANRNP